MTRKQGLLSGFLVGLVVLVLLQFRFTLPLDHFESKLNYWRKSQRSTNRIIPRLQAPTLAGDKFDLADYVGDSIVFLYFTRAPMTELSWSESNLKKLEAFKNKYDHKPIEVFAVLPYDPDLREQLKQFKKRLGVTYPFILDRVDKKKLSFRAYNNGQAYKLRSKIGSRLSSSFHSGHLFVVKPNGRVSEQSRLGRIEFSLVPFIRRNESGLSSGISRERYLEQVEKRDKTQ